MKKVKIVNLTSEIEVPFKYGEEVYTLHLIRSSKKTRKKAKADAKPFNTKPTAEQKELAKIRDKFTLSSQKVATLEKRIALMEKNPQKYEETLIKVYSDFDTELSLISSYTDKREALELKTPEVDFEKDLENSEKIFEIYAKIMIAQGSLESATKFADVTSWRAVHDKIIDIWGKEDQGNLECSNDGSSKMQKVKES